MKNIGISISMHFGYFIIFFYETMMFCPEGYQLMGSGFLSW